MIDLHTHSLFSDGVLLPSELVRRCEEKGRKAVAITDHIDVSNLEVVIPRIVKVCEELNRYWKIQAIPGAEITHVPPETIAALVNQARKLGAEIVVVHGETIVEPVLKGTNRAAIDAGADILAHPGLITDEEVILAGKKNVYLEISGRKGHSYTNGHVAALARKYQAGLVFNSDAHSPEDIFEAAKIEKVILGAGLSPEDLQKLSNNSEEIIKRKKQK